MNRRTFLKSTAVAVGTAHVPMVIPSSVLGRGNRPAPSDRITLACIGTGNQGLNNLQSFLQDERVQLVAVCDINESSPGYWNGRIAGRKPAQDMVNWTYGKDIRSGRFNSCDAYIDFQDVMVRDDIDGVVLSLPDHWHAIPVLAAAKVGKDIYGEKPLSLTIAEGRAMSDAVRDHGVIFQTGSQQRSDHNFRRTCELVRNQRIGTLKTVRVGLPGGTPDFGRTGDRKAPEPVPKGFDYDKWLGPAPHAPYSPARCHVNFRWILDYSGGQITDWGGHHPDIAQWGMDTEGTGPIEILNPQGVFSTDAPWNTATEFSFECRYKNGVRLLISDKERRGVTFEGSDGWVFATRGHHEASSDQIYNAELEANEVHLYKSENHHRNFIDCMQSRKQPVAPIETAHRSISIAHLGNIALRLGRDLKWNPDTERFVNDAEADGMLSRPMRAPWTLE